MESERREIVDMVLQSDQCFPLRHPNFRNFFLDRLMWPYGRAFNINYSSPPRSRCHGCCFRNSFKDALDLRLDIILQ